MAKIKSPRQTALIDEDKLHSASCSGFADTAGEVACDPARRIALRSSHRRDAHHRESSSLQRDVNNHVAHATEVGEFACLLLPASITALDGMEMRGRALRT